jgi:hypothetical protein
MTERTKKDNPGTIGYAVMGLFFSVYDYDKDISQTDNDTVKEFFRKL